MLASNCCGAPMLGEPTNNWLEPTGIEGRCADCKEMAEFIKEDNDETLSD